MKFDHETSLLQQKMSNTNIGNTRRQKILRELNIESGQTILDIGCGGGQLLEEISLSVGDNGKVFGLDPSETQINSAKKRCGLLKNVEFICDTADKINLNNCFFDAITSIQTLEYIVDLNPVLNEIKRLLKNNSKFVNISTLWDFFGFHGPDKELNLLIHESVKKQAHSMLPIKLEGMLKELGFRNIQSQEITFFLTKMNENSFPKYFEENMIRKALKSGVSEKQISDWKNQLYNSQKNGKFAFTSVAIMTVGSILK